MDLSRVYGTRFAPADAPSRRRVWFEITRHLARNHLDTSGPVLDLACDRGDFIRSVVAPERWATDLRDVGGGLPSDVRFVMSDGLLLGDVLPNAHFSTVFMSNYLEHLPSSEHVVEQLRVVRSLLRPGGRVVILQPNIRLVGGAYWDFIDHHTPLTERSLAEASEVAGLRVLTLITRFLPFTSKGRLPQHALFVRAYLAFPPAWRMLGGQTLLVATRPG